LITWYPNEKLVLMDQATFERRYRAWCRTRRSFELFGLGDDTREAAQARLMHREVFYREVLVPSVGVAIALVV